VLILNQLQETLREDADISSTTDSDSDSNNPENSDQDEVEEQIEQEIPDMLPLCMGLNPVSSYKKCIIFILNYV
jgi:hypothetical protein